MPKKVNAPEPIFEGEVTEDELVKALERAGMGRPTKYDPKFIHFAKHLAKLGATDQEAADAFQVHVATLQRWKLEHPDFRDALIVGKEEADARVEKSLYSRALGYSHEAVKISINSDGDVTEAPFTERYPPDTTAAIFWLKNRRPDLWRDVKAQEISAPGGEKRVINIKRFED